MASFKKKTISESWSFIINSSRQRCFPRNFSSSFETLSGTQGVTLWFSEIPLGKGTFSNFSMLLSHRLLDMCQGVFCQVPLPKGHELKAQGEVSDCLPCAVPPV